MGRLIELRLTDNGNITTAALLPQQFTLWPASPERDAILKPEICDVVTAVSSMNRISSVEQGLRQDPACPSFGPGVS